MEEIENRMKELRKALKLKVAIMFGYNGKNYRGLQFHDQEGIETVEKQLFKALSDGGFILPQHMGDVKNVSWTRGARTDKGVHALVNTIGVKINLDQDKFITPLSEAQIKKHEEFQQTIDKITDQKKKNKKTQMLVGMKSNDRRNNIDYKKIVNILNSHIPSDIKVFSVKPVTSGFNVRHAAKSRKYEYYMPLRVFQSYEQYKQKTSFTDEEADTLIDKINDIFQVYEGTKNFHNFTIKIKAKDPEAVRYMINLKATLCETDSEKWVRFQLHGASFMYHQIRKMIGMISMIFQKDLPKQFVENAFFQNHVSVWLAPAEGLFLNRIMFCGYNRKGDVPMPLVVREDEEKEVEIFRQYLQHDVVLSSGKIFEEYVQHFMELSDEQIDEEQQKDKKPKEDED